jgi:DNA (cytosine-5)-methyltransferase 1
MTSKFSFIFKNAGICRNGVIYTIEVEPNKTKFIPLRNILQNGPIDSKYFLNGSLDKWKYLKGSKKIPRVKPNGEQYNYSEGPIAFPENLDLPARTMLTSESSVNRSTHVVEDLLTKKYRLLTEIECERLNGFPDDWTNTGMPSKFRYFCMGNALVVPIIRRIGLFIANMID